MGTITQELHNKTDYLGKLMKNVQAGIQLGEKRQKQAERRSTASGQEPRTA